MHRLPDQQQDRRQHQKQITDQKPQAGVLAVHQPEYGKEQHQEKQIPEISAVRLVGLHGLQVEVGENQQEKEEIAKQPFPERVQPGFHAPSPGGFVKQEYQRHGESGRIDQAGHQHLLLQLRKVNPHEQEDGRHRSQQPQQPQGRGGFHRFRFLWSVRMELLGSRSGRGSEGTLVPVAHQEEDEVGHQPRGGDYDHQDHERQGFAVLLETDGSRWLLGHGRDHPDQQYHQHSQRGQGQHHQRPQRGGGRNGFAAGRGDFAGLSG